MKLERLFYLFFWIKIDGDRYCSFGLERTKKFYHSLNVASKSYGGFHIFKGFRCFHMKVDNVTAFKIIYNEAELKKCEAYFRMANGPKCCDKTMDYISQDDSYICTECCRRIYYDESIWKASSEL